MKQLLAVLFLFSAAACEASDFYNGNLQVSRFGFEFQQFRGGDGPIGTEGAMLGVRDSSFFMRSRHWSLGVAGYFGTPHGGDLARDNLFYAGMTSGVDTTLASIFVVAADLIVGYGYGNSNISGATGQSVVLQPSVSAGFVLVNGWRASFTMGYLYMPSASGFSNRTYGIRLERKTESQGAKGVDY